jgi:hypothetical protein
VARVARVSRELGREVATPAEARQLLGITPRRPRLSQMSAAAHAGASAGADTESLG